MSLSLNPPPIIGIHWHSSTSECCTVQCHNYNHHCAWHRDLHWLPPVPLPLCKRWSQVTEHSKSVSYAHTLYCTMETLQALELDHACMELWVSIPVHIIVLPPPWPAELHMKLCNSWIASGYKSHQQLHLHSWQAIACSGPIFCLRAGGGAIDS